MGYFHPIPIVVTLVVLFNSDLLVSLDDSGIEVQYCRKIKMGWFYYRPLLLK